MAYLMGTVGFSQLRYLDAMASLNARSAERLASGRRINRAADDPAGLTVFERLRSSSRENTVAALTAREGVELLQAADGALAEITSAIQRMRSLAVQAADGTLSDSDRQRLAKEFASLRQEIDRVAVGTRYNGRALLDGTITGYTSTVYQNVTVTLPGTLSFTPGAGNTGSGGIAIFGTPTVAETYAVTITQDTVYNPGGTTAQALSGNTGTGTITAGTNDAPTSAAAYTVQITSGGNYRLLDSSNNVLKQGKITSNLQVTLPNGGSFKFSGPPGHYKNGDRFTINTTGPSLASQAEYAVTDHLGGTVSQGLVTNGLVSLGDGVTFAFTADPLQAGSYMAGDKFTIIATPGGTSTQLVAVTETKPGVELYVVPNAKSIGISIGDVRSAALGLDTFSISSQEAAQQAIFGMDAALVKVAQERGNVGAQENAFELRADSLEATAWELDVATERMGGADIAREMLSIRQNTVRMQSAISMVSAVGVYKKNMQALLDLSLPPKSLFSAVA